MNMQAIAESRDFWEFNIGHVIDTGLLVIAAGGYMISRKSDIREAQTKREKEATETARMHTENKERLEVLMKFHESQENINRMRDEQVSLLREQTAAFKHMAEGLDRRLQIIENRKGSI